MSTKKALSKRHNRTLVKSLYDMPQRFSNGRGWYYEDPKSIDVYLSGCGVNGSGSIPVSMLVRSLRRMGWSVSKTKKKARRS